MFIYYLFIIIYVYIYYLFILITTEDKAAIFILLVCVHVSTCKSTPHLFVGMSFYFSAELFVCLYLSESI